MSCRVLRPPGGASNISFGADDEKPVRKNKMASSIFAEPDDPHAHRRNNPPGNTHTHTHTHTHAHISGLNYASGQVWIWFYFNTCII